jgi:hypothetical protein
MSHNHLRITRIIRCLRILGLEKEAQAFYRALKNVCAEGRISRTSEMYWTRAAKRPLNIPPDMDDEDMDERVGKPFLREWEQQKSAQDSATDSSMSSGEEEEGPGPSTTTPSHQRL